MRAFVHNWLNIYFFGKVQERSKCRDMASLYIKISRNTRNYLKFMVEIYSDQIDSASHREKISSEAQWGNMRKRNFWFARNYIFIAAVYLLAFTWIEHEQRTVRVEICFCHELFICEGPSGTASKPQSNWSWGICLGICFVENG